MEREPGKTHAGKHKNVHPPGKAADNEVQAQVGDKPAFQADNNQPIQADHHEAVQPAVQPEGGTKQRIDPSWLFGATVAIFGFGGVLLAIPDLSVWAAPVMVFSVAPCFNYLYRPLKIFWAVGMVVFLAIYLPLYLPQYQNRDIKTGSWTPSLPLIPSDPDKNERLLTTSDLPNYFDGMPPIWAGWSYRSSFFREAHFSPQKAAVGLKVSGSNKTDQEIVVSDTDPVLFPPLSNALKQINDFTMDLTFDFNSPQNVAAWAIRTDEARTHYYLFAVWRDPKDYTKAWMYAWRVSGQKVELIESQGSGPQSFPFPIRIKPLNVHVHLEADTGCDFKYSFLYDAPLQDSTTCWPGPEIVIPGECYTQGRPGLVHLGKPGLILDQEPDSLRADLVTGNAANISAVSIDGKYADVDRRRCVGNPAPGGTK
jgi:hypothetical protein